MDFLGGVFIGMAISVAIYTIKIDKIKENYKRWESQYKSETRTYKPYKDAYYNLYSEYNKVVSLLDFYKRNSNTIHINNDIKSALRFAMIYSHPDKGNCKENDEFIKFKKLYDEYR